MVAEVVVTAVGSRHTCICSITFCTSITLTFSTPSASSCARPCSMNSSRTFWRSSSGDRVPSGSYFSRHSARTRSVIFLPPPPWLSWRRTNDRPSVRFDWRAGAGDHG